MIYIFTFTISIICFAIGLYFRNKNKFIFCFFSFFGLFFPCILAGLRDYTIGTDVNVYVAPLYQGAKYFKSFSDFITNKRSTVSDIFYLLLSYICAKKTTDITLLLFLSEFLVIYPIYKALLLLNQKKRYIIYGMLLFFLFFYNQSFNMARQSIAISLSILAMAYIINNRNVWGVLLLIAAFLFHKSTLIMIPIIIIYKYLEKEEIPNYKKNKIKILLLSIVIILIPLLPKVLLFLINHNLVDYQHFSDILVKYSRFEINETNTLFYALIYILITLSSNLLKNKINNFDFYKFMSLLSIFILQFGAIIKFSERIGYYSFYMVIFFLIPKFVPDNIHRIKKKYLTFFLIMTITFILYWFFWIILKGYHGTYPYIFRR